MSTTVTRPDGTSVPPAGPSSITPATPARTLTARRRRPALLGLSIALVATGGLLGAYAVLATGQHASVLALARPVTEGAVITDSDLTTASITLDPAALKPIRSADRGLVVGKRAANDLHPGALVTKDDLTDAPLVAANQQLVGILLKPGQLPSSPLAPGMAVLIVTTPTQDPNAPSPIGAPPTMAAKVVRVGAPDTTGALTLDVAVPATDGPVLAARAATGRIAVIVAPKDAG
ncbi:SAF domain-containing protein [Kitasatospora kifunensis]|uniref:SAF domain-containing protein n=1 Tax=Kitasatospora kifunensis TaxID=58351 RepID=A0A7W7W024_KITKI|nr:SAF domain-containing protein [Kitasatospora kifunensis]MBB4929146.1 hypothetical protein [Kitasatospora kifunensis]